MLANPSAMLRRAFALLALLIAHSANADTFDIAGTSWFNDGTEHPSMCITFAPDGELKFKGGFVYYNPARWKKVEGLNQIEITLGGKSSFPTDALDYQLAHRPGSGLLGYDAKRRLLRYEIGIAAPIDFAGFYFYRQKSCGDA